MSMLSSQIDALREASRTYQRMGNRSASNMLKDAADTIWQLRDDLQRANAENAKLRKENDTLCRRIDELCMENERLRHTARRIVVSNHDTDCATGHSECSECRGTVNPCARFCEHCGALFKEGE